MKVKLLKRFIKGNKMIDIWQDNTICLLPYINITIIEWKLFESKIGWLFWDVRYYGDYKPCGYVENNVRLK